MCQEWTDTLVYVGLTATRGRRVRGHPCSACVRRQVCTYLQIHYSILLPSVYIVIVLTAGAHCLVYYFLYSLLQVGPLSPSKPSRSSQRH